MNEDNFNIKISFPSLGREIETDTDTMDKLAKSLKKEDERKRLVNLAIERIKKFQNKNCKGCFFADVKKVGTGEPCCTKPTPAKMRDAETCIDRRLK